MVRILAARRDKYYCTVCFITFAVLPKSRASRSKLRLGSCKVINLTATSCCPYHTIFSLEAVKWLYSYIIIIAVAPKKS